MQAKFNINILQYDISNNISENIFKLKKFFVNANTDSIIVLPEMFNTGFNFDIELVNWEDLSDSLDFLKQKSKELNSLIMASSLYEDNGNFYNRLFAFESGKLVHTYDKRHLFCLSEEKKKITKGKTNSCFNYKGIKIKTQICYDLRFPVWVRNDENYDLLIYTANWPASRNMHWESLLKARAIENQSFTIACNRIGRDTTNVNHIGNSLIFNANGDKLVSSEKEELIKYEIDFSEQSKIRERFPFLEDKDDFKILNI
jgi:predicted amidohydrolase